LSISHAHDWTAIRCLTAAVGRATLRRTGGVVEATSFFGGEDERRRRRWRVRPGSVDRAFV
jgi:hypothetical protein